MLYKSCFLKLINNSDHFVLDMLHVCHDRKHIWNYSVNKIVTPENSILLTVTYLNTCSLLMNYDPLMLGVHPLQVLSAVTYQIIPADSLYAEIPLAAVRSINQHKVLFATSFYLLQLFSIPDVILLLYWKISLKFCWCWQLKIWWLYTSLLLLIDFVAACSYNHRMQYFKA